MRTVSQKTLTMARTPLLWTSAVRVGSRAAGRAEKLTPEQRSEIAKKAAQVRWGQDRSS